MNIIHTNCCLYCELVCVSAVSTDRMNLHLERGFSNINFVLCMHVALLLEHSSLLYHILFIAYSIANVSGGGCSKHTTNRDIQKNSP